MSEATVKNGKDGERAATLGDMAEVARTAVSFLPAQHDGQDVPSRTVLPVEMVFGDTA